MHQAEGDAYVMTLGHVAGLVLPVAGPALLLVAFRGRGTLVRRHILTSLIASAGWVFAVVAIISIDIGRFSIDEQDTSSVGLLMLLVAGCAMLAVVVMNIRRAKEMRAPLGWH